MSAMRLQARRAASPAATGRLLAAQTRRTTPPAGSPRRISVFIASITSDGLALLDRSPGLDVHLPHAAAAAAPRPRSQPSGAHELGGVRRVALRRQRPRRGRTRRCRPSGALGVEGGLAAWPGRRRSTSAFVGEERAVVARAGTSSARCATSRRPSGKSRRQLVSSSCADRIEADWSKKRSSQGLPVGEGRGLPVAVPHLDGAPDELVAARSLHAVDAQVGAADADAFSASRCGPGCTWW